MKSRVMYVLLAFVLCAFMAACSSSGNIVTPDNSGGLSNIGIPTSSPSPSPDGAHENTQNTPSGNDPVLEAYKAVLQNEAQFYSIDNKKEVSLDDFLTNKEMIGAIFQAARFTVIDMDGDTVPEVILELTVQNNPEFYEILRYVDGSVYGYNIVYRGLEGLKTDGTFYYSNGAADNGYGKLKFHSDAYETDILGYMESSQSNEGMAISYFVDNKPVTEESFQSFMKAQDGKEDVSWYEFSQENVNTELSVSITD